jgi:acyl dehydratase
MKIFESIQSIPQFVGQGEAISEWIEVTQEQINHFADATGDRQWIHTDPERAKTGPFGATIAHGFFTLSLMPQFFVKTFWIKNQKMGINYGVNKVRFTSPVLTGSLLRARISLKSCTTIDNGMQSVWSVVVECKGSDKPVCVAETITRHYA